MTRRLGGWVAGRLGGWAAGAPPPPPPPPPPPRPLPPTDRNRSSVAVDQIGPRHQNVSRHETVITGDGTSYSRYCIFRKSG